MKLHLPVVLVLALVLQACSVSFAPATPTPIPSSTPAPTRTNPPPPTSTDTPQPPPTGTPTPTYEPAPNLDATSAETQLRANGYKRYPFYEAGSGEDAFFWDNGSGVVFYTYSDGLEIAFMDDPRSPSARGQLIDTVVLIITPLFAPGFVAQLQDGLHAFAERVSYPSGDPTIMDYGLEPWLGMLFEYNAERLTIPNGRDRLPVTIRLLTRQYKCDMNKYLYCFFYDMPSMTFTGDASLTFLNILVDYP